MRKFLKLFVRDERGVSALEYAILAGIIVAAVVAGATTLSTGVKNLFSDLSKQLTKADNAASK